MIRFGVRVARDDAGVVLAELLELVPAGVEEVELEGGIVEYAVYGAPGELPELPDLRAAAGGALVDVVTTEVGDDWAQRWREFHQPLEVGGGRLRIRAPWHQSGDLAREVVIDPGRAFGTGAHATTRLCLEALCELRPGGPLVDAGCGSGVLAIAAAKLGFGPVTALDFDPLAVEATADNAAANGVAVDVARWDLRRDEMPATPVVLANLLRPLLLALAPAMSQAPPRVLIASGLLAHEADEVAAAFAPMRGRRLGGPAPPVGVRTRACDTLVTWLSTS